MNLDDLNRFKQLDTLNLLGEIDNLPDQLGYAYQVGLKHPLPNWTDLHHVVIAGMGSSAIGADLLAAYCASLASLPVSVQRGYGLPLFARGAGTLVICSSHSGNTEETLDAFEVAHQAGCRIVVVATGGELARRAKEHQVPLWSFDHAGKSHTAVGFSFGLLLALFQRLGLIGDQKEAVDDAVASMKRSQGYLKADIIAAKNPAKRYAGQLMGRWVTIMGSDLMTPVARRWKGQLNVIAKAGANFDFIPEADHNTLLGTTNHQETLNAHTISLFLRADSDHPRNRLRSDMTRQAFMLEGMNTDHVDARGNAPLAHIWTTILFGDYMAYYLAMAYGIDPSTTHAMDEFKKILADTK